MTGADQPRFAQLLGVVYAYYRRDLSPLLIDLWWNGCEAYDFELVKQALGNHMQDPDVGKFLPLVADVTRVLRGTASDRAALAWGKVHEAMGSIGAYRDVVFDDPAIHCAIADMGGWPRLVRLPSKDLGFEFQRFAQFYRAYTKALPATYPRVLVGDRAPDEEWEKRGLKPPVTPWGDRASARLVFEGRVAAMGVLLAAAPAPQLEHRT